MRANPPGRGGKRTASCSRKNGSRRDRRARCFTGRRPSSVWPTRPRPRRPSGARICSTRPCRSTRGARRSSTRRKRSWRSFVHAASATIRGLSASRAARFSLAGSRSTTCSRRGPSRSSTPRGPRSAKSGGRPRTSWRKPRSNAIRHRTRFFCAAPPAGTRPATFSRARACTCPASSTKEFASRCRPRGAFGPASRRSTGPATTSVSTESGSGAARRFPRSTRTSWAARRTRSAYSKNPSMAHVPRSTCDAVAVPMGSLAITCKKRPGCTFSRPCHTIDGPPLAPNPAPTAQLW